MCLSNVSERRAPNTDEVIGYKVVQLGYLNGDEVFYTSDQGFEIRANEWVTNPGPSFLTINEGIDEGYPSGFHIFAYETDANDWADGWQVEEFGREKKSYVVKVKGKDIRCVGLQKWGFFDNPEIAKVYVCNQIRIEGEINSNDNLL
jgi:hypothetical protein